MPTKTFTPAFKARVGDWDYYLCLMSYGQVAREISFLHELRGNSDLGQMLQRGIGAYLDDLHDNADPLHPIRLVEELDQRIPRAQAEHALRLILEALLENQDILRDYNQTCTQADFGDTYVNTIGGPALVVGQLQRYKSVMVRGTAKSVAF